MWDSLRMPLHSITHMFEYVYHDTRSNSSAQTAGMQKQKCLHANAQVYAIGSAANWSIYPTLCKDGGCSASNNMHLCLNALLQPRCSCSQDAVAAKMPNWYHSHALLHHDAVLADPYLANFTCAIHSRSADTPISRDSCQHSSR